MTNTGSRDAADVVIGYMQPPGAGQNGVPLQYVFGFERVWVPAGKVCGVIATRPIKLVTRMLYVRVQTVTVWLGLSARDLTQVQPDGTRVAWPGKYTVRFGLAEGEALGAGFAQATFTAA